MGNRLTKIVTRSGDNGDTGLADGSRLAKDHPRIEALGAIDELNSQLGMVRAFGLPADLDCLVQEIQQRLFDCGGELALPGSQLLRPEAVTALEQTIENLNTQLPPLREFLLPGGPPNAAACHLARAQCRRAERRLVQLSRQEQLHSVLLRFFNRLSDLLFVLARQLSRGAGADETQWQPPEKPR